MSVSLHLPGVCLGMQLAVVEFSRNVLGWQGECPFKSLLNSCLSVPGGPEAQCLLGDWEPWGRLAGSLGSSRGAVRGAAVFVEGKHSSSK